MLEIQIKISAPTNNNLIFTTNFANLTISSNFQNDSITISEQDQAKFGNLDTLHSKIKALHLQPATQSAQDAQPTEQPTQTQPATYKVEITLPNGNLKTYENMQCQHYLSEHREELTFRTNN